MLSLFLWSFLLAQPLNEQYLREIPDPGAITEIFRPIEERPPIGDDVEIEFLPQDKDNGESDAEGEAEAEKGPDENSDEKGMEALEDATKGIVENLPLTVFVTLVRPNGQVAPAEAEVRLEREFHTPGGSSSMVFVAKAKSKNGVVRFSPPPPAGPGERDRVVVRYHNQEVSQPVQSDRTGPIRLIVYETSVDTSVLYGDMRIGLTPMDRSLRVEHLLTIENPSHSVIDVPEGLPLPVLLPAPFGRPLQGLFPTRPDPNHFRATVEPRAGQALIEKGVLYYKGSIPPEGLQIQILLSMPYEGETSLHLGLETPFHLDELVVISQNPKGVDLRFHASEPMKLQKRRSGSGDESRFELLGPLPAHGKVQLSIANLPDRHGFLRPFAAAMSLLMVAFMILFLATAKKKA